MCVFSCRLFTLPAGVGKTIYDGMIELCHLDIQLDHACERGPARLYTNPASSDQLESAATIFPALCIAFFIDSSLSSSAMYTCMFNIIDNIQDFCRLIA